MKNTIANFYEMIDKIATEGCPSVSEIIDENFCS